ncbi:hypothetical protein [Ligilactobacillus ruminis]|uniref:hypothetical protein n=1 Tax=Ligilactobacillus ruminis TaxID=1623 RepID=UPI0022E8B3E5|nr:hypothetical protein [Ligilactobacillus ruminis]
MNEEKEPVVPVPAGVLAALEAICSFANCKTINHKEILSIISSCAEEVEEGLKWHYQRIIAFIRNVRNRKNTRGRSGEKVDERNPWKVSRREERSSCTVCR